MGLAAREDGGHTVYLEEPEASEIVVVLITCTNATSNAWLIDGATLAISEAVVATAAACPVRDRQVHHEGAGTVMISCHIVQGAQNADGDDEEGAADEVADRRMIISSWSRRS